MVRAVLVASFEDPSHPGNGIKHHTGRPCIEPDCYRPAGTWWSPHWCFECNVERIKRITVQLDKVIEEHCRG